LNNEENRYYAREPLHQKDHIRNPEQQYADPQITQR
jgi:hypothetical protein